MEHKSDRQIDFYIWFWLKKKNNGFNKTFSPILSNKFLIRITKFLLSLQYFVWKQMKTKDNKNFVILIKKCIWQYRTKYFVEPTTFVFSVLFCSVYTFIVDSKIFSKNKYRLLDCNLYACGRRAIIHARFLIITKRGYVGRSQRDINVSVCVCVGICSRRFNVYHCDICGCTCIINTCSRISQLPCSHCNVTWSHARLSRACNVAKASLSSPVFCTSPPRETTLDNGWVAI